jgi:hypothetical protein
MNNVRNFWLTTNVDGRKTVDATGPRSAGNGFTLRIQQRENGSPSDALRVEGNVSDDGTLRLVVLDADLNVVHEVVTKR